MTAHRPGDPTIYRLIVDHRLDEIACAVQDGAIAAVWRTSTLDGDAPHHRELDGRTFLIPNNWALKRGLMKAEACEVLDDAEFIGEVHFCRCRLDWIYALADLPADMLADKAA